MGKKKNKNKGKGKGKKPAQVAASAPDAEEEPVAPATADAVSDTEETMTKNEGDNTEDNSEDNEQEDTAGEGGDSNTAEQTAADTTTQDEPSLKEEVAADVTADGTEASPVIEEPGQVPDTSGDTSVIEQAVASEPVAVESAPVPTQAGDESIATTAEDKGDTTADPTPTPTPAAPIDPTPVTETVATSAEPAAQQPGTPQPAPSSNRSQASEYETPLRDRRRDDGSSASIPPATQPATDADNNTVLHAPIRNANAVTENVHIQAPPSPAVAAAPTGVPTTAPTYADSGQQSQMAADEAFARALQQEEDERAARTAPPPNQGGQPVVQGQPGVPPPQQQQQPPPPQQYQQQQQTQQYPGSMPTGAPPPAAHARSTVFVNQARVFLGDDGRLNVAANYGQNIVLLDANRIRIPLDASGSTAFALQPGASYYAYTARPVAAPPQTMQQQPMAPPTQPAAAHQPQGQAPPNQAGYSSARPVAQPQMPSQAQGGVPPQAAAQYRPNQGAVAQASSALHVPVPAPQAAVVAKASQKRAMSVQCPVEEGQKPCPRYGSTMTQTAGSELVLFGGKGVCSCSRGCLGATFSMNTNLVAWLRQDCKGSLPPPRYHHAACALGNGRIAIFGGKHPSDNSMMNDLHILDTKTWTWSNIAHYGAIPSPRELTSLTLFPDGKTLMLFGGIAVHNGTPLGDMYTLDTTNFEWSTTKSTGVAPAPRCAHTATAVDSQIVVIGGRRGTLHYFNDVYVLDTDTFNWTGPHATGLSSRAFHVAERLPFSVNIVLYGGCDMKSTSNDVAILNTQTMQVTRPSLATPRGIDRLSTRYDHAACVIDCRLFVSGGLSGGLRFGRKAGVAGLVVLDTWTWFSGQLGPYGETQGPKQIPQKAICRFPFDSAHVMKNLAAIATSLREKDEAGVYVPSEAEIEMFSKLLQDPSPSEPATDTEDAASGEDGAAEFSNHVTILRKLLDWAAEHYNSVLELLCLLVNHPRIAQAVKGSAVTNDDILRVVIQRGLAVEGVSTHTKIRTLMLLANMFYQPFTRDLLTANRDDILTLLNTANFKADDNPAVRSTYTMLLLNYATMLVGSNEANEEKTQLLLMLLEILHHESVSELLHPALLAIGNLIYQDHYMKRFMVELQVRPAFRQFLVSDMQKLRQVAMECLVMLDI